MSPGELRHCAGTSPLLSVVIPTWNRAHLVCESIDSALIQRPGAVEVVVVDDGSTDDTAVALEQRHGNRIKLLRTEHRGCSAARNTGLEHVTGALVAFLDSDDVWLPGKLDAELDVFERFPEADVVISDSHYADDGQPFPGTSFGGSGLLDSTGGQVRWMRELPPVWARRSTVATCSMTMRCEVLEWLGTPIFPETLVSHEDWDLEIRLCVGRRVAVLPEVWAHVRRYDDDSRGDREFPGRSRSPAGEAAFLRDRLTVLERTLSLAALTPEMFEWVPRSRDQATIQLQALERGSGVS